MKELKTKLVRRSGFLYQLLNCMARNTTKTTFCFKHTCCEKMQVSSGHGLTFFGSASQAGLQAADQAPNSFFS